MVHAIIFSILAFRKRAKKTLGLDRDDHRWANSIGFSFCSWINYIFLMRNHILFTILTIFLGSACVPKQEAIEANRYRLNKGDAPWIIAHGGAKKLFPENTMMAFRGSTSLGVDALEMDVAMTKDGILVTHHDLTIDRMSNGTGKVIDYTYEELLQFNFGHSFKDIHGNSLYQTDTVTIGKLEEVFSEFNDWELMVELKDKGEDGKQSS